MFLALGPGPKAPGPSWPLNGSRSLRICGRIRYFVAFSFIVLFAVSFIVLFAVSFIILLAVSFIFSALFDPKNGFPFWGGDLIKEAL